MKLDELVALLSSMPADSDVGVRLGDAHLDIAGVSAWGEGAFVALVCHQGDLRDVLIEWGFPADRRVELIKKSV